jgi:hypothetical protein
LHISIYESAGALYNCETRRARCVERLSLAFNAGSAAAAISAALILLATGML